MVNRLLRCGINLGKTYDFPILTMACSYTNICFYTAVKAYSALLRWIVFLETMVGADPS